MNRSDRVATGLCPVQAGRSLAAATLLPRSAAVAAVILSCMACLATAQTAPAWRYDLRTGDHLIYRYSFQRQRQSNDEQTQSEARFRTHVLVTGEKAGRISLGFQRNREAAELTQFVSKGKDRLAREQPEFQKRMQARRSRFSEAMEVSASGEPRYPWEMAREAYSDIINALHEVVNLPPVALAKGETWRGAATLGFDLRWVDDEPIHGQSCHHIEATTAKGSQKLSYWWSPQSGVVEQVVFDGTYFNFDTTVHETARMELESRTRGESLEHWLGSPDTREGALQSILLTPEVPVSAEQLGSLLSSLISTNDAPAQALALAIASRRGIVVTPDVLRNLRQNSSALIQTEVRLLSESQASSASAPAMVDECHRPLPLKPAPSEFGTTYQAAPATKDTPEVPYLLRVPLSYREERAAPLLIYLSGGAGFALDAMNSARGDRPANGLPGALSPGPRPLVDTGSGPELRCCLERRLAPLQCRSRSNLSYRLQQWRNRRALFRHAMAAALRRSRFPDGCGQCNEQVKAGLANLRNLPLLFVHGENDPIITPDCSTTTRAALNDLHPAMEPELKILPKRGHDITLESDDGLTLAFFQNKLRNPFPRTVALTESNTLAVRAYWVEILDGKPGKSDIDARIKADNTIEIHSHNVKSIRLHLRSELLPKPGDLRIVWNGKKMFSGPLRDPCSLTPVSSSGDPKLDLSDARDFTLP